MSWPQPREVKAMAKHHGGKLSAAAATLASNRSGKRAKSDAGKTLANHKHRMH